MKCKKCGSEIPKGRLYCSKCGYEVQFVTGEEVLEDEYLNALLKNGAKETETKPAETSARTAKSKRKLSPGKMAGIAVCCLVGMVCVVLAAFEIYTGIQNANSYDYQMSMAEEQLSLGNQEKALHYYQTALSLMPDDVAVRMEMAAVYLEQEEYDTALVLYLEVVKLDRFQKEAYENLIALYERNQDYESIIQLSSYAPNDEIAELFDAYEPDAPVISPISGTYGKYINVNLDSLAGDTIYYTMDESTPDAENGTLYDSETGIPLTAEGVYTVRAVCVNEKGIYSEVSENQYVIELVAPRDPIVTPSSGAVETGTAISIFAQAGCSVYYTWDGTDPTAQSARYEEPLTLPEGEGEKILSVLVIDDNTGLSSSVFRASYTESTATEGEEADTQAAAAETE